MGHPQLLGDDDRGGVAGADSSALAAPGATLGVSRATVYRVLAEQADAHNETSATEGRGRGASG